MKKIASVFLVGISICSFADEVVVYGPNSMKWIGKKYAPIFKEKTGHDITFVSVDGLVPRLKLEKKNPKGDIVMGLTQVMGETAKKEGVLEKFIPKNLNSIEDKKYIFDEEGYVTPFDYGLLAINYDAEKIKDAPKNLEDISKLKKSLIIEDPRSATGQELLFWSVALYGKEWKKFWNTIQPSIYNVAPGWSEAFSKFTAGEAPMMTGYATSSIFFYLDKAENKYKSFIPEEGGYVYLEGAALIKKDNVKPAAKEFMDQILEKDFQKMLMEENYMFPVIKLELPESFKYVPTTEKTVILNAEQVKDLSENMEKYRKELIELLKK